MSAPTEPSLRIVKSDHDLPEDPRDRAHASAESAHDASASYATSAPAHELSAVSGEIANDWNIPADASPGTTLLGVGTFPAQRQLTPSGTTVFVTPATVAAIARAKQRSNSKELVRVDHNVALERTDRNRGLVRRETRDTEIMERPPTGMDDGKWRQFEDLGLAPRPITRKAQKVVVSAYRLLGFGILSVIVFVLVGYISTTAFYFLNTTWITPVAVSANDEKVVTQQSQLAAQINEREKLVHELEQSERRIKAEQAFQLQFAKAIKHDVAGRRLALNRVQALASSAAATRRQIKSANAEFSQASQQQMAAEYDARLISRDSMLAGKHQLAQIESANLSLAERQAEFDQRAAELAAQTQSLDALLANKDSGTALSYDVLKIARDYETSKLELARETSNRDRLKNAIVRQESIIEGLSGSAYLRAVENGATVALVPYDNLHNAAKGTKLYACRLSMVWCRPVGEVSEILPGEVQIKHPKRDTIVRGRMIEMKMTEPDAAYKDVLFLGGAPLKF